MALRVIADGVESYADDLSGVSADTRDLRIENDEWYEEPMFRITMPYLPRLEVLRVKRYHHCELACYFVEADDFFEKCPSLRKVTASLTADILVVPPNLIQCCSLRITCKRVCDIRNLSADSDGLYGIKVEAPYVIATDQSVDIIEVDVLETQDYRNVSHSVGEKRTYILCPNFTEPNIEAFKQKHGVSIWDHLGIDYPLPWRAKRVLEHAT